MELFEQISAQFSSPIAQFGAAAGVGAVLGLLAAAVLKLIESRSSRPVIQEIAKRTRSLAFVIGIIVGLRFGLNAFEIEEATLAQLQNGFTLAIFLLATWAANLIYDSFHEAILVPWGQRKDNSTLVQVGQTIAHVLLWLLGGISGLNSTGYDVTSVLAGLGIGGLAFALAAQDTVANIFGGVVVLTQSPFRVGDKIEVNGITGWVNNIGIRSTVIDTWKGYKVTMPNKVFTDSHVINIDTRTEYWENMQLKLRHDATTEQIQTTTEMIYAIIADNENLFSKAWVGVCNIGEGFVEIEVWYGTLVWKPEESEKYFNFYAKQLGVKHDFHMSVLRGLEAAGIPLATPVQGIFLHEQRSTAGSRF